MDMQRLGEISVLWIGGGAVAGEAPDRNAEQAVVVGQDTYAAEQDCNGRWKEGRARSLADTA